METISIYKNKQKKIVEILSRLLEFLKEGEAYGLDVDPSLLSKIESSIKNVECQKLKVALVGGFSEGKTSIAAAWSERYDKSTMKISQAESTDGIQIYDIEDDYQIIDTPGLFGFKETDDKEKYKNITKKYVSEADLIIYVMSSDNPIKESHKEELKWLFQDLDLLPRTVFVLSRFDEEADLTDDDEYSEVFELKKQTVIDRLIDFGIITSSQSISIVAVSADPYGKGIEEWLKVPEEYRRLSHINGLQKATTDIVCANGGSNAVTLYRNQSVVKDVMLQSLPMIETKMTSVLEEVTRLEEMNASIQGDKDKISKKISKSRINLREFIIDHFTDLIVQAKGCSVDTIDDFFDKNIGDEGIVLQTKIENEFDKQVGEITSEIAKIQSNMTTAVTRYNSVIENMTHNGLKTGAEFLKAGKIKINNNQVLAIRDAFFKSVRFKPWGAIKLANKINSGLSIVGSVLGIGLELWDSYSEYKKKQIVEDAKAKIVDALNQQMREYIALLDSESEYTYKFFPAYTTLKEQSDIIQNEVLNKQRYISGFKQWKMNADVIDAEFREITR